MLIDITHINKRSYGPQNFKSLKGFEDENI